MSLRLTIVRAKWLYLGMGVAAAAVACKSGRGSLDQAATNASAAASIDEQAKSKLKPAGYAVPELTPAQLASGLRSACERAAEQGTRLLIEFSAPWCGDCVRLAKMKQEAPLAKALSEIPHHEINIGDFDQHEALLDHFRVKAIAKWQIVESTNCAAPPTEWPKVKARTLEPRSGKKKVGVEELAGWLTEMRSPSKGG